MRNVTILLMSDTINNPNQNTPNNINPDEVEIDKESDQSQSINSILNTELSVENIDNYAEDTFNKLVIFAEQKVEDYKKINPINSIPSGRQTEDAAFEYYGVEDITSILDYIINENNKIRSLDNVIARSKKVNNVIVETDNISQNIPAGNGDSFKEKKLLNRLKTVLYILEKKYQVDTNNENQLKIIEGDIRENMMRRTSYFMLDIAQLNRTILVCDEEGNASYVFNSDALTKKEISNDYLIGLTKSELNELIKSTPELGRRVVYSKNGFIPRIIDSIDNPNSIFEDEVQPELSDSGRLLFEKAPEGYKSMTGIINELRISDDTVKDAIEKIKVADNYQGELEANIYKFGANNKKGYSPEQQAIIKDHLEGTNMLNKEVPEGYMPITSIASDLGISDYIARSAIEDIKADKNYHGELEAGRYRFSQKGATGYSPRQQTIIKNYLENMDKLNDKVPEGYKSMTGIANELEISQDPVIRAIDSIKADNNYQGELEAGRYRFSQSITTGYSPEQQTIIKNYLENIDMFSDKAPEGYKSMAGIINELRTSDDIVKSAIGKIKAADNYQGELETNIYKFSGNATTGYSPEQQKIIKEYLNRNGKHI